MLLCRLEVLLPATIVTGSLGTFKVQKSSQEAKQALSSAAFPIITYSSFSPPVTLMQQGQRKPCGEADDLGVSSGQVNFLLLGDEGFAHTPLHPLKQEFNQHLNMHTCHLQMSMPFEPTSEFCFYHLEIEKKEVN